MKKLILLFYACVLSFSISFGQGFNLSSEISRLDPTQPDSVRYRALINCASYYMNRSLDSTLNFLERANKLANRLEEDNAYGHLYISYGDYYSAKDEIDKAKKSYSKAIKYFIAAKNSYGTLSCMNCLGNIHSDERKNTRALEDYFSALKLLEKEQVNPDDHAFVYINIANVYQNQERFDESLNFYRKALNAAHNLTDTMMMATCYNNMAIVIGIQNKLDTAIAYYEKAIELATGRDNMLKAIALNNLGETYIEISKYNKSFYMIEQSLLISKKGGFPQEIKESYRLMATLFDSMGYTKDSLWRRQFMLQQRTKLNMNTFDSDNIEEEIKTSFSIDWLHYLLMGLVLIFAVWLFKKK